jgi:hypothetical protein
MKMTIQIILGLIILIAIASYVIRLRNAKKKNTSKTDQKVLMKNGRPILKQFGDLSPSDFNDYPIWVQSHIIDYGESWYDSTDEETFRPWIDTTPVSPDFAMFLIKANLKLSNGEIFSGFITPCLETKYNNENDLGLIQPQIFTKTGKRICFWTGRFPIDKSEIDKFYQQLDKTSDQIFPIDFYANEGLSNGVISGKINGFLTIGENKNIIITK